MAAKWKSLLGSFFLDPLVSELGDQGRIDEYKPETLATPSTCLESETGPDPDVGLTRHLLDLEHRNQRPD